MNFKSLRALIICPFLCFTSVATAALIQADYADDNDNLAVFDDISGLTWLDLSVTTDEWYRTVETEHAEWRYATNSEVEDLFLRNFTDPDYKDNGTLTNIAPDTELGLQALDFRTMFGSYTDSEGRNYSYGLYKDELGDMRMAGVFQGATDFNIYGPDFIGDYSPYDTSDLYTSERFGTFMVKRDVPEPSTLAIFALGMIGLASRRFKKQS